MMRKSASGKRAGSSSSFLAVLSLEQSLTYQQWIGGGGGRCQPSGGYIISMGRQADRSICGGCNWGGGLELLPKSPNQATCFRGDSKALTQFRPPALAS